MQFACNAGAHYLLQLGGETAVDAGAGTFTLAVSLPPANDDCSAPATLAGIGFFSFDTSAATTGTQGQNESLCASYGLPAIDHDTWYSWTAPTSGIALVSTSGLTSVDTKLAAYAGTGCPVPGSALACRDQFSYSAQAEIFFAVHAGASYTIQLGTTPGGAGGTGQFSINVVAPPAGDNCHSPRVLSGTGLFPFDNTVASTGAQGQNESLCAAQYGLASIEQDLWFTWTAPSSGTAVIDTCGQTTVDTKIALYTGTGCPVPGSALACADDSCPSGGQTTILLPVTAGSTFTIQLGSAPGSPGAGGGTGSLSITVQQPPSNDDCSAPLPIAGLGQFPFDDTVATTGSAGQSESMCANGSGTPVIDHDVWFAWSAPSSGCTILETCNLTSVDTKLAVYAGGGCPVAGSALACNDDECGGLQSSVRFTATAGQSYLIQIGTLAGAPNGGTGLFGLSQIASGLGNDECSAAIPISGLGFFPFDNSQATTGCEGQSEPLCFGYGMTTMENDVWFLWTAPASGTAVCDTCSLTTLDTKMAVYQGGGCPTPGTALACNDDTCGLESSLVWTCTAGASYAIQIANFPGAGSGVGSFLLNVVPPPTNDDCSAPIAISGSGSFPFSLLGASTGTQGQHEALCSFNLLTAIENDVWYTWTAPSSGRADVSLCSGANFDSKLAIYAGAGCPALGSAIACNDDACSLVSQACFDVVGGQSYTIQLGTFPNQGNNFAGYFDINLGPSLPACTVDDGTSDNLFTWYYGGDIVWLNRFGAAGATTVLSSVDVMWGSASLPGYNPASNGQLASDVFVWQDGPTQDGDPSDATLLLRIPTTVSAWDSDTYVTFPITPLSIQGVFFVGTHQDNYGLSGQSGPVQTVVPMDENCPQQGVAWYFGNDSGYGTSPVDYANPANNVRPPATFFSAQYPSQVCIRAGCSSGPASYLCDPGSGSVVACPCANPPSGAGRGCNNSSNTGGASIHALGTNSLASPTLHFTTADQKPTSTSVLLQGTTQVASGTSFGQGVRCAGGSLKRLYVKAAVGGSITAPNLGGGDLDIPARSGLLGNPITAGQDRYYLVYYRDPIVLGSCVASATFNDTNTAKVTWQP